MTDRIPIPRSLTEQQLDRVHARVLRCFSELVSVLDGEPQALLEELLPAADAAQVNLDALPFRQQIHLLELAATRLGCPDFGMRLATLQQGGGIFGPVGEGMRNCATYGEALDFVQEHAYAHSLAVKIWSAPLPAENALFCGHELLLANVGDSRQFLEHALLAGCLAAQALTAGRTRPRRVHLRHAPVASTRAYRRFFGCDLLFSQPHYGVVFATQDLLHPLVARDEHRLDEAIRHIEQRFDVRRPPLHAQVRGAILRRLGTLDCSNEAIAAELNMHSRTLHRRLGAEGCSFLAIKDQVRKELLLYFLHQTELDMVEISDRLAFAEQSVMSRNCRRWFSASPSAIRRDRPPRGTNGRSGSMTATPTKPR